MAFKEEAAATASAASVQPAAAGQTQNVATTVSKPSEPPGKTEDGKAAEPEEDDDLYLKTRPEVMRCNWVQFKNRIRRPSGGAFDVATVELLVTSETLDEDIEKERLRRMDRDTREKYRANFKRPPMPRHNATRTSELSFERVRINSSIVLKYLARVSGNSGWPLRPHTFLIPFAFLIHNHDKMRAELESLEEKLRRGQGASEEAFVTAQSGEVGGLAKAQAFEAVMVSDEACSQMRCYVDFVAGELIQHYRRFEKADYSTPTKIRFDDLWCLYRYNELLCRLNDAPLGAASSVLDRLRFTRRDLAYMQDPPEGPAQGTSASTETHTIVRAKWVGIPCHEWDVEAVKNDDEDDLRRRLRRDQAVVGGFYLDHDGTKFAPVGTYVYINYFHGERDIHKLPIFPVRFLRNKDSLLKQLRERGTRFRELVSKAGGGTEGTEALAYEGWSRTTTPLGEPIGLCRQPRHLSFDDAVARSLMRFKDVDNSVQPEYISSDIILDFQEAFQSIPAWRPDFDATKSQSETMPEVLYDSFHILCWADKSRKTKVKRVREAVVVDDFVAEDLSNRLAQSNVFLKGPSSDGTDQPFTDDDLVLLPPRLMAYALRDRKFFHADIERVREKDWRSERNNPFESLKIDDKHKDMILSIVNEHFEKQELAENLRELGDFELPDQDFIGGKGQGLVVLLHGDPGVGKTATAEAVALSRRRPLFLITCGDLGITPDSVEGGLKQIFRLANLWKCVLLLDEADIFLSQRERTDESIMRNAMVSIFLRTLEYYPGILFLTTNRVGVMDEAVKSRVHVSLHYPALNLGQTLDVFGMNITRLQDIEKRRAEARRGKQGAVKNGRDAAVRGMTVRRREILAFAEEHFKGGKNVRWNGRQIRNAFQIAASLAHFQQQDKMRRRGTGDLDDGADGVENAADRDGDDGGSRSAPYIGREHFEQVAKATADFDRVRRNILRMSDGELAYQRAERAHDGYVSHEGHRRARQMPLGRPDQQRTVNGQSFYEDDRYQNELDRRSEKDLYERDRHRGDSGYRGGAGGRRPGGPSEYERGYGRDGSVSPPPRRRDGPGPSRGQDRSYRDERVRYRSVSRSRSRSRSGTRLPAREGMPKQRQPTRVSGAAGSEAPDGLNGWGDGGRGSGGRGGGGGDYERYGRLQFEKEPRRERDDWDEGVSEDTGGRRR